MIDSIDRPLFEEPSSDCEREDPWSGPKGFMFGGWSLPSGTAWDMAEQYFDAANTLLESIEKGAIEDYRISTPVLFLYRHWLELSIKSILGPNKGHSLANLLSKLELHLSRRGTKIPGWVKARILELASIDPESTSFRYADGTIPGEIYVSLPHLKRAMKALHIALASVLWKGEFPPENLFRRIADDPFSLDATLVRIRSPF